ncbi:hypothetical protein B0J13DRAFT_552063 [Dactylonectria estremocensis]|uniref:ZZ-type domain-containing protein n=1 Tax=Dactylonectria estremocensis TaxID=1079267 RepID=A0A9P9EZV6_9HYPO|nr:hypothetical protein B0J13DRAFT_552063 [Dactylonectria estremocensis]
MASGTPSTSLDNMITVKVQFDGVTRRTKMPLRDMVPKTLEGNIRTFLHLPAEADVSFERYSDSAGAFVHLAPENVPIYKQLYRAAKAKSKLKIRVTVQGQLPKTSPKAVTIEDEPEAAFSAPTSESPKDIPQDTTQEMPEETPEETPQDIPQQSPLDSQVNISPAPTPTADAAAPSPSATASLSEATLSETTLPFRTNPLSRTYNLNLLSDAARLIGDRPDARRDFESRLASLMEQQSGLASRLATTQAEERARRAQIIASGCHRPTDHQHNIWAGSSNAPSAASCALSCAAREGVADAAVRAAFAICCNSCEKTIPDVHYHCSTCDDGDFDLCQSCVERGITCHGHDHWLIKRTTVEGRLIQSTTETIAPKLKKELKPIVKVETKIETKSEPKVECKIETMDEIPSIPKPTFEPLIARWASLGVMRTCNCCVQELPEYEFLHCNTCEDYDLCQPCFNKNAHGHHPQHGFAPAVKGTEMPQHIKVKMAPGRNQMHHAICDGCDKYIAGVRHKCLDCPDWDYCANCIKTSKLSHPSHRFIPIYDQLVDIRARSATPVHVGICCDGPLCNNEAYPAYIRGIRYKCAVCNDTDFCANCEANPRNTHNKTHPMIMFKTPVRHVSVTTTGEHQDGQRMPSMGDRKATNSKATETVAPVSGNTINPVQTIVDMKPSEPASVKLGPKKEKVTPTPLSAVFVSDTIVDGTILAPNHVFEQTWILRNEGTTAWPAGCSVKFVGGDYMGHVDSNHPARISELVSASESTVCYNSLAPGQEFPFTVLLRTPGRAGKLVSYWRLTSPSGDKFGHRLWCDVSVRTVKSEPKVEPETTTEELKPEAPEEDVKKTEVDDSQASSQMIFPKLEKESPMASIHEAAQPVPSLDAELGEAKESADEDWDLSEDGFMTDEEYDILDASDEEYLEAQKKKVAAK